MTEESSWAPLRHGLFRALWLTSLASNTGTWMQTVGAQWLLVHQPNAAFLVALVQTADTLPDLLFAYVGGILADILDRRKILISVQMVLTAAGLALTVLTAANHMPPGLLLGFTFVLGAGSAFTVPAYQALVPDLVPRSELVSASALGSISINVARAVGPAIAGILIARVGVAAVFGINTATFLAFAIVAAVERLPAGRAPSVPEHFVSALRAGGRYVVNAPVVRRILLRATLFLLPATALWALLPVIASQRLGLGAQGYGLLLGALGVGAVSGALVLPRVRARLSNNALMVAASLVYAAVLVVLVLSRNAAVSLIALLPAGVAWIAVLSTINGSLQLFLPAWVRARGLSIYQMVLFGTQAIGAVIWGALAEPLGLQTAFLIAAAIMVAGTATIRVWPFYDTKGMDRRLAVYWPVPHLVLEPDPDSGPVGVQTVYTIAPDKEAQFLEAIPHLRQSRLRTGATEWSLFRDGESAHRFVEFFVVPSWEEHLRQHSDRLTGVDRQYEAQVDTLSDPPPQTDHLIGVRVRE